MKRFFLFLSVLFLVSISVVSAQYKKYNEEALLKKIAANDEAIKDPKKSNKASVWLERGELYYRIVNDPIRYVFLLGESKTLITVYGEEAGVAGTATVNGRSFATMEYPAFTAYINSDKRIAALILKQDVKPNALDIAAEAYQKAFDLDFEVLAKVQDGLNAVMDYYRQLGNSYNALGDVKLCAEAYAKSNEVQRLPLYSRAVDPMVAYYAGYMYVVDSSTDPSSYALAEKLLNQAVADGYCAVEDADESVKEVDRGAIYYYLFHCAHGQSSENKDKLMDAKRYLLEGLGRYPRNENIFDGILQLYTTAEGMGDPMELLSNAEESIKLDPKNVNAWYGRGRIYYAAKQIDKGIESFEKVIELDPGMAMAHFYMGVLFMHKADEVYNEIKDISYSDRATYESDINRLNSAYALAIPHFEKSFELDQSDKGTVSYLKQLYFRLREEPGMMEKYEKYNALYDVM